MKTIKKLAESLDVFVGKMFGIRISVSSLAGSFFGIIVLRVFEERFLASAYQSVEGVVDGFLYNFFFFILLYLLIWSLLSLFLKVKWMELSGLMAGSFWLILFPPILDMIRTGGEIYWSFYALDGLSGLGREFITVFGNLPSGIVYFGTRFAFVSAIFLVGSLVLIRTRSYFSAIVSAFCAYLAVFVMGTLPSWLALAYFSVERSKKIMEVSSVDIVQFFGSTHPLFGAGSGNFRYSFTSNLNIAYFFLLLLFIGGVFFWTQKQKFRSFIKNARMPQLAYHAGLFGAGMGLGAYIYPENISLNLFAVLAAAVLLVSVWLAWEASVVVNDIYDFEVDKISNGWRPLQKKVFSLAEYSDLGIILFCLSILGGVVVGLKFAILIFVYQTVAWFYSAPPFRLKRFPVIATFFSAIASIMVVFVGFSLFSGQDNIKLFPWRMILLLLFGLTLSLPIKDFKDIDGDKSCGVWTVPALFGMETGRIIVGSGIFISYMLSVFFLNEFELFWWAMLSGTASFWLVINKKPRQLFWWVMGVVAVYAVILVKIIFLS